MSTVSAILHYPTPTESSSQLQLRESHGTIRIIFGVWPMWLYALAIAANSLVALLQFVVVYLLFNAVAMMAWIAPPQAPAAPLPLLRALVITVVPNFLMAILYGAAALLQWYRLYRWGRIPRTLTATSTGLTISQMGWLGRRHRFWPSDQIDSIELRPSSADLFRKRTLALLRIRRHNKKLARSFRLLSADSQLPTHVAERLAATLGCKLIIR